MSVLIRAIEKADEARWRELWQQYNDFYKRTVAEDVTTKTLSRFFDENVRLYSAVAVDNDSKVVGFVNWYPHPSTSSIEEIVYLHDLFVDPSIRNKGAGRLLIQHVYEQAKSNGASSVYWHTQFFNHRAQLLYVKVGERTDFVKYNKDL